MLFCNKFTLFMLILALFGCRETSVGDNSQAVAETGSSKSGIERLEQSINEFEQQTGLEGFVEPWTGDLDTMVEKRRIRVLTVYNPGRYYIDQGQEKGLTYEWFKMFETFVNQELKKGHVKVHVVFIPMARDELFPALLAGHGDIVAAGLTITPERAEQVTFSDPATGSISEILVTGPKAPKIEEIEDLAGQDMYVRASSSYRSSLEALNERFVQQGLEPIVIIDALEQLEDQDILEMVNAGLIPWAVVDSYKTLVWKNVFKNLEAREDIVFRSGGRIGYAMRKGSPQLTQMLNEFLKNHKQGTLQGNILINRYLKDFDWAESALSETAYKRFDSVVHIFQKFGTQYGIDYLMVAAQGYQESRLDQNARSAAGAIGIMQLLPSTAADSNVGIPDITQAEPNIHAGIKYLDFIRKRYFSDEGMDIFNQTMFAFAAYNAGPARVRQLREKAAAKGYDPNIWFDNVELIAAREIGRETVQYVANILKYYIAYSLSLQQQARKQEARDTAGLK